jgi:hypothetical protein
MPRLVFGKWFSAWVFMGVAIIRFFIFCLNYSPGMRALWYLPAVTRMHFPVIDAVFIGL